MMRNPDAKHINFEFLQGFIEDSPKVIPSNIDMVLERYGHFIFGEWKRENEQMGEGQKILLRNLAKLPNITVLIITGHTDNGMNVSNIQKLTTDSRLKVVGKSAKDLKKFMSEWYANALYEDWMKS
jgi:hypothetical protein